MHLSDKIRLAIRCIIVLALLGIPSGVVISQSSVIDSLQEVLTRATDPIQRGELLLKLTRLHTRDLAKYRTYLDEAASIKSFAGDPKWAVQITYLRGQFEERSNRFDSARVYFQIVLDQQNTGHFDTSLVSAAYYKMGDMSRREGHQDQAIEFFQKSIQLDEADGDQHSVAGTRIALGVIYKNLGLYDEAVEYYNQAYQTYEAESHYENMATCILNIANVYSRQAKYSEAITSFQKALEISEHATDRENLQAYIFGNLGNCYTQQGDHARALEYTQKAYAIMKDNAGPEEQATMLIGISNSQRKLGQINEAIHTLEKADELSKSGDGLLQVQARIQLLFYHTYVDLKRIEDADKAIGLYLKLHDSLQRQEVSKQLLEVNTKYETEKKENQIELLNAENKLVAANLRASKNRNIGLLAGFIVVGLLLTVVYRLFQRTKVQNAQITLALKEKETLLKEIHHRIKNNLQVISSLLALQSEHVVDDRALSALQEGQDRVQSMALIHQNLYQEDHLTGVSVKDYFEKLIRNLFNSYNIHRDQIKLELNVEELNLDVDTVVPIGLIVNELVSNSLKYAFPGKRKGTISVSLGALGDLLKLEIMDDGIGMTDKEIESLGTSFGHRLVEIFTRQLKGKMRIDGTSGTRIQIDIGRFETVPRPV
ncbi:MAG: tetratricopeptide repeat protein [Saprospiraceae bacterium]|nr:tetratricopeptide repeat protein [Saprospiraceae bacterium]